MSSKERLAAVLESILDRFDGIEARFDGLETQLTAVVNVAIDVREEVDRLRLAIADEAERAASARARDLKRVQEHEARIAKLERFFGPQAAE